MKNMALFLLFLCLTVVFISARDANLSSSLTDPKTNLAEFADVASICPHFPNCLRVGSAFLGQAIQSASLGLFGLFASVDPMSFGATGWMASSDRLAGLLGSVLYRLVVLLPILAVAMLFFERGWRRVVFLVLTWLPLAGWGSWLYVPWYDFIRQYVDWPVTWWDFRAPLAFYDYAAIGFVFFLIIYMGSRARIRLWEIAALAAIGQFIFEYLGLVTAVSLFVFTLLMDERGGVRRRLGLATGRLAICGVSAFAVLMGLAWIITNAQAGQETGGILAFFKEHWQAYGRLNIQAIHIIMARFLTLLSPSFLVGVLFGGVLYATLGPSRIPASATKCRAMAGMAAAVGYGSALGAGLFISGVQSDMGRQAVPLTAALVFAGAYFTVWAAARPGRA